MKFRDILGFSKKQKPKNKITKPSKPTLTDYIPVDASGNLLDPLNAKIIKDFDWPNKNADWNFQWDWSEACQFTRYSKGQFYDWHCDSWDLPYTQEGPTKGKIRKLSVTVSLSDPKDYKGGELEFDFRNLDPDKKSNIKKCKEILPKGSLIVFPSFVWHRVCPVKRGTRYSLVIWNLGWPYK